MNRIVVTGASSMIGAAIVEQALNAGCEQVFAVVRAGCGKLSRLPLNERVKTVFCNIDQYERLPELIHEGCEVFYHIAWDGTGASRDRSIQGQANNVVYTLKALHAAKDLGCRMFIGAGSQAEYGKSMLDKIGPDALTSPISAYGVAKYAAGRLGRMEADRLGLDFVWARVFSVYGKYDKETSMISSSLRRFLRHEPADFTGASQRWDYLFSDDAGRAFVMIGQRVHGSRVYCIGSGQSRPLRDYIVEMRDAVDPTLEISFGKIPYTDAGPISICADISALTADTGWQPVVEFQQGIRECIRSIEEGNF